MTTASISPDKLRAAECKADGIYFNRYFFKQRLGSKMIISGHHAVMQAALDRTMLPPSHPDFIPRLIVSVPPGYTKTEMGSINYIARGIAKNSRARFLHLSYSHALALKNSSDARGILKSKPYQGMWPVKTKDDTDSKAMWWTQDGGGVYATSSAGQVTGFRAGHMDDDEFTGALIIDDPVKPDDAYSEVMREGVNNRYNETIASRVAVETVPIIVIMQRIHDKDLSGYLLRGGSGEKWHHLNLPVIIDKQAPYPSEYTHGIPIEHDLPDGWLWPFKHNDKHELALKSHRRKFAAQYMQKPIKRDEEFCLWGDSVIDKAKAKAPCQLERVLVSVDPAASNTKTSDDHGIVIGGKRSDGLYTVMADRTCRGSPKTWAMAAIKAYEDFDADAILIETNQGGDMCEDTLRNAGFDGRIIRVHASKGKTARAEPVAALYEMNAVRHEQGLTEMEEEMLDFDPRTGLSDGKSPNRVDAVVWLLTELSGDGDVTRDLLEMALGA